MACLLCMAKLAMFIGVRWQVLERLPIVNIKWRHPHLVQAKPKALEGGADGGAPPGQEYQIEVQLQRVGGKKSGSGLARVYAPRFPKVSTARHPMSL